MGLQLLMPHAEQELRDLAESLVAACPDMRQMARDTAASILRKHGHPDLDPDHVHLNRFEAAQSSPRTFSGWEHHDAPYQSFTLPQLVMHRFDVHDQDNSDLLGYLSGFYCDGPGQAVYDEHNEIALQPQDVLEDFWDIDFSTLFQERLATFWRDHADNYRLLAKVNFLSKVIETCAADPTSELAVRARRVAKAITGLGVQTPTLTQLRQSNVAESGYRVCTFDIAGYIASDWLRIEMEDGQQLLYTPGDEEALNLFATRKDLYWWVLNNTNHADNRTRFMSHFPLSANDQSGDSVGLNHMIDLLFYNWGGDDHHCLNQVDRTIAGDAFSHLRDSARQRMNDDAHFALRSNGDLRKQMWIGYLAAFAKVFGPIAAIDWPIALAAVGAGIADMGLNIDQAVNGHTTGERQAGVKGAIFAAIDTLFNATMLHSAAGKIESVSELAGEAEAASGTEPAVQPEPSAETEPVEELETATVEDVQAWVPEPFRPAEQQALLEPYETNIILSAPEGSGGQPGIYLQHGNIYVLIDDEPYQVRYVNEMRSWVVIDPQNPYSFYRNIPIAMDDQGLWQPLERPGLKGGMMPRKLLKLWGRVTSPSMPEPLPTSAYDIPADMRPRLESSANSPGDERVLNGTMFNPDPEIERANGVFRETRDRLAADAQGYLASVQTPPRPKLPELAREATPKQIIRGVFENSQGMVIGEAHSQVGSKKFLIDNMALLKREKVKVLYLEHFMTDFQQTDLDLFNRSGEMPATLKTYVRSLDLGFRLHGFERYTFENLLLEAQRNGIRLQSIDCMASYRQAWAQAPSPVIRQQMMNFYAHEVIAADKGRAASKWVALVGNSHANTFEQVPGMSELEGVTGMRVEDIALDQPGGIGNDPGLTVVQDDLSVRRVKSDLRLQVPIRQPEPAGRNFERTLRNIGSFTIDSHDNALQLIHRSNSGQLQYTPILEEGSRFYIDKPNWPWISGRRLRDLQELRTALTNRGLRYVWI